MRWHRFVYLMPVCLLPLPASNAVALDPAPVKIGEIDFIPTVKLRTGHDDNIRQAPSGEEESSWVTGISPHFLLRAQERRNVYEASYRLRYQYFHSDTDENRDDHFLYVRSQQHFSARSRLRLRAGFNRIQFTEDEENRRFDEEGNIREQYRVSGVYGYGARTAKGQIELGAHYLWNRYDNNLDTGSLNREEEYDNPRVRGTFYWRVAPKTRALFEIRYDEFDYVWSGSDLDSYNVNYLVGLNWRATAKTSGVAKFGYEDKNFSDNEFDDRSNPAWEVSATWKPMSRTSLTLRTISRIAEGSSTESYIERQRYRLNWLHEWSDRFSSDLRISRRDDEYKGGSNDGREDKIGILALSLNYHARRWLDIGLEGQLKQNDSTLDSAEYDRNRVFLTVNMSL